MAPEMLFGFGYDQSVDIWSLGVILYELLHGSLLFKVDTIDQLRKMILKKISYSADLDPVLVDLMDGMLQKNPEKRLKISAILNILGNLKELKSSLNSDLNETKTNLDEKDTKKSLRDLRSEQFNIDETSNQSRSQKINSLNKKNKTKTIFKKTRTKRSLFKTNYSKKRLNFLSKQVQKY